MDARRRQPDLDTPRGTWLHRRLRRWCLWIVLLIAAAAGGWSMLADRVDEEIRRFVEERFATHYTQFRVSVASARRIEGQGIEIRDLSITDPLHPNKPLLHIDELFVKCQTEVSQVVTNGVHPSSITVRQARLHAVRDADGQWNVARLWPPPKLGTCNPHMLIRNARVELDDSDDSQERVTSLREINLDLIPVLNGDTPHLSPPLIQLSGSFSCDHLEKVDIKGSLDPAKEAAAVQGHVTGLLVTPRWFASLPRDAAAKLEQLKSLRGRLDFDYELAKPADPESNLQFRATGSIARGEISDPRLPHALRSLQARFDINNQQLQVTHFTARNDDTIYRGWFQRNGFDKSSPWQLQAHIENLYLSERFSQSLPNSLTPAWNQFQPRGTINLRLGLIHDGQKLSPTIDAECLDVSGSYEKFPYPFHHLRGRISYSQGRLTTHDLVAGVGGSEVEFDVQLDAPGRRQTGFFKFNTRGPVPLDQRLMSALKTCHLKTHDIVNSLQATGHIVARGRFDKVTPDGPLKKQLTIEIVNGAIKYEKFRYPLNQLTGTLDWTNNRWSFRDLTAYNDSAYIACTGHLGPNDGGESELVLYFRGTDIPLEDELRDALPAGARKAWLDLRPRGTLDHLAVTFRYLVSTRETSVTIDADKYKPKQNVEGRSMSIDPVWFPYRMNDVSGHAHYKDGAIELSRVQARHNAARMTLRGRCAFDKRGNWFVHLQNLNVDRMQLDHELLHALPEKLGGGLRKLNVVGPISMRGEVSFAGQTGRKSPPTTRWDLQLDLENGQINCGPRLDNVRGAVTLAGIRDEKGLRCHGEVNVDSLFHRGIHVTWLRGPLAITDQGLLLGAQAVPRGEPSRSLTGSVWSGGCSLDAYVAFQENSPFRVALGLQRVNVKEVARDLGSSRNVSNRNLSGKADVQLNLNGNAGGTYTWVGNGGIQLREADIYEMPLIIALITPLRNRPLDRTAFTSSDIRYRIQGQHVYFDQIDFLGEAMTLKGIGEMDLQRRIKLQFYTLVGRDDIYIPFLRPVLGEASRQILMIEIAGTLDAPQVTQKAFPKLNEALRQLFPETVRASSATANQSMTPTTQRRAILPRR